MTSKNQDIDGYYAGDTLQITITVQDDAGNALDLTGATVEWVLVSAGERETVLSKDSASGGIALTDAANGEIRITIDPADTESLKGLYRHEAEVTDASGNTSTVTVGDFEINGSHT